MRGAGWLCVADSETGDSGDLLVLDADCADRRPDLRVSLGESGGPIGDWFAIVYRGRAVMMIDVGGLDWLVRGCHTVKEYKYGLFSHPVSDPFSIPNSKICLLIVPVVSRYLLVYSSASLVDDLR